MQILHPPLKNGTLSHGISSVEMVIQMEEMSVQRSQFLFSLTTHSRGSVWHDILPGLRRF